MADTQFLIDAMVLLGLSLPLMAALAWMIWLMYHSYSLVCNIRGARAIFSFIAMLLLAEVLSKLIYWMLFRAVLPSLSTKPAQTEDRTPAEQRSAMQWAKRLKRVFQIDVETCPNCGGTVKIIASIEDPPVIERILNHLASKDLPGLWAESRAPPSPRIGLPH